GPVAMIPPRRTKFHYDWHWFWATGNGDLGNQGIHQMDVARWFLGEPGIAPHTLSVGGRLGYDDDGETPNTQVIVHDYAKAPLIFEVRGLSAKPGSEAMDKFLGASIGIVIHCEGGHVVVPTYTEAQAFDKSGKLLKEWKGSKSHFANFIDVVRSRRTADLRGPIHEGHVSSALCHTGNISYQLGKATPPDELREKIKGNAAMAEAFGRMSEHLGVHDVKLDKTPATLGLPLSFDTKSEKFTGNDVANTFVKPEYRAPYVIKV
ncbi:MAG TPA: hypothetical protein VKC60_08380, partial [Opitutaceae bacterium]|nr:hypothetical protein [Opitutaceae bacterium]